MALSKKDLIKGFKDLGIQKGDTLLVHSSLSSFGKIEGGPDTVIEALIESIGKNGTLLMPVFGEGMLDLSQGPKGPPSGLGALTEAFRVRSDTIHSLHPTHSVAAWGKEATAYVKDHIKSKTASGKNTPYGRLISRKGYILLLGVDQDRNTTLHTLEEYADAPYLSEYTAKYRDYHGKLTTITLQKFPGPHRNFIGLDKPLRNAGIVKMGKIGNAVCRLMRSDKLAKFVLDIFKENPAAVLCDNPACADCRRQKGKIYRSQLAQEPFTLAMDTGNSTDFLEVIIDVAKDEGIHHLVLNHIDGQPLDSLSAERIQHRLKNSDIQIAAIRYHGTNLQKAIEQAKTLKTTKIILPLSHLSKREHHLHLHEESKIMFYYENIPKESETWIAEATENKNISLAFNPAHFAFDGYKPFLKVYSKRGVRNKTGIFFLEDGRLFKDYTFLEEGNGEVKELLSISQCRSFSGLYILTYRDINGLGYQKSFQKNAAAFRAMLNTL